MAVNELKQIGEPAPKPESTKHLRVLANGTVYDMNRKRIVSAKGNSTAFATDTARAAVQLREEGKREAMRRGANAIALQGGSVDGRELAGDYAFVEAISEAMTIKAMTVNDPKAVDAARFVFAETGVSIKQDSDQPQQPTTNVTVLIAQYIAQYGQPPSLSDSYANVIDGDTRDAEQG